MIRPPSAPHPVAPARHMRPIADEDGMSTARRRPRRSCRRLDRDPLVQCRKQQPARRHEARPAFRPPAPFALLHAGPERLLSSRLDGRSPTGEIAERLSGQTAETSQISADGQGKLKESEGEHLRAQSRQEQGKQCKQIR